MKLPCASNADREIELTRTDSRGLVGLIDATFFKPTWSGNCELVGPDRPVETYFELGAAFTLIAVEPIGWYLRVYDPNGGSHTCIHPSRLRKAVRNAVRGPIAAAGWRMPVAALDEERFRESRSSLNSGFLWPAGPDKFPIFMLDPIEDASLQSGPAKSHILKSLISPFN